MRPKLVRTSDFETCRRLLAQGSKTFKAASLLLPRRMTEGVTVLYAFCRIADDAVDGAGSKGPRAVADLRDRLDGVFAERPRHQPVDRALSAVVAHYDLPRAPFDALLEGFLWDTERARYETFSDVCAYAARVAGSVGVLMTYLMGVRDRLVLARACDLGVAMQLTNIARDVGEDANVGRLYLPASWLRKAGMDVDAFVRAPTPSEPVRSCVERLLFEAETLYRRSEAGILDLPSDVRGAIYAARLIYAEIGARIRERNFDSISGRAYVPTSRKLTLLARALATRPSAAYGAARLPPLPEVEFLLPRATHV